jgi:nucleotide-binding universal stress UspA family protein
VHPASGGRIVGSSTIGGLVARIVVGVDGSTGSRRALAWAVEEARYRGDEVVAATVFVYTSVGMAIAIEVVPTPARSVEEVREDTARMLHRVVDEVVGETDVKIIEEVAEGVPARRLIELATGADMIVVGSRGLGGFRGLLLGSVSQQVVHHAPCPVVVVPATGDEA